MPSFAYERLEHAPGCQPGTQRVALQSTSSHRFAGTAVSASCQVRTKRSCRASGPGSLADREVANGCPVGVRARCDDAAEDASRFASQPDRDVPGFWLDQPERNARFRGDEGDARFLDEDGESDDNENDRIEAGGVLDAGE